MHKKLALTAAILSPMLILAGCSDDEPADDQRTAPNGQELNDADVAFATEMIPHHAQALVMVDMTMGRSLDPEVEQLTEDIRTAQAPEIETMSDWLTEWGEPVPETARDHANSHGDPGMDSAMPGMSPADIEALEGASNAQFQDLWLEMMINHHEGAVEMARTEQEDGLFEDAVALAESIETSQGAEIDLMQDLLDA